MKRKKLKNNNKKDGISDTIFYKIVSKDYTSLIDNNSKYCIDYKNIIGRIYPKVGKLFVFRTMSDVMDFLTYNYFGQYSPIHVIRVKGKISDIQINKIVSLENVLMENGKENININSVMKVFWGNYKYIDESYLYELPKGTVLMDWVVLI